MRRPQVKVCGIKREDEAAMLSSFPVSYAGFIFAEGSRRKVDIARARKLRALLGPGIKAVGVFVDADRTFIEEAIKAVPLDGIQLHGSEPPEFCEGFKGIEVWKAIGVSGPIDSGELARYGGCSGILLDTSHKGQSGGTGKAFDWHVAAGLSDTYRIILAGGLNPENAVEAARLVEPHILDMNSGLEENGFKTREKLAALFERLKEEFQ